MQIQQNTPLTWQEVKDFVATLDDEQLGQVVLLSTEDRTYIANILEAIEEDCIEPTMEDGAGAYPKSDYLPGGGQYDEDEPINPDEHPVVIPKGTVFLFAE